MSGDLLDFVEVAALLSLMAMGVLLAVALVITALQGCG